MKTNILKGRVIWVFDEQNFDIDRIIGIENIKETNVEKLIEVCMTEFENDFVEKVQQGDWIIGGKNFGYGHPHRPAMIVMRHLGVKGVIAESFSPGFYRGQIADGVPLIKCDEIVKKVSRFDQLSINWEDSLIINETTNETITYDPLPKGDKMIVDAGGHIPYLKQRLSK